jgi:hypothetical protein
MKTLTLFVVTFCLMPLFGQELTPIGRYVVDKEATRASLRVAVLEHYIRQYEWDDDDPQVLERMDPIIENEDFIEESGKAFWDMRIIFQADGRSVTERLDGSDSDTGTWSLNGQHVTIMQEKSIWHFIIVSPGSLAYVAEGTHVYMRTELPDEGPEEKR